MPEEVKTRIGRTIRKDGGNERFHTTVPIRFVEELVWKKGDRLYLVRVVTQSDVMLLAKSIAGAGITLCCRGDRYFYITLPTAIIRYIDYDQGDVITWAFPKDHSPKWGLILTFEPK